MEELKSAFGLKPSDDENSIFGILRKEHKQVKENLQRILDANKPLPDIMEQTIAALNTHMRGEESFLYPRLEDNANTRQLAFMSYEEHNLGKQIINSLSVAENDNDRWMAKVRVLYNILVPSADRLAFLD